jgi:hypothetical protein
MLVRASAQLARWVRIRPFLLALVSVVQAENLVIGLGGPFASCALVASILQALVGPTAGIATLVDINHLQQRRHASSAHQGILVPLVRTAVGNETQGSISRNRYKARASGAPLAISLQRPEVLVVKHAKRAGLQRAKVRASA